jgi:hypothetical protein
VIEHIKTVIEIAARMQRWEEFGASAMTASPLAALKAPKSGMTPWIKGR